MRFKTVKTTIIHRDIITLILLLVLQIDSFSQDIDICKCPTGTEKADSLRPCAMPEKSPKFPGGERKLLKFLKENSDYKILTKNQLKDNKSYYILRVCIEIDKNGEIIYSFVLTDRPELESDIKRMLNIMPNWKPATQIDRNVFGIYSFIVFYEMEL